MHFLVPAALEPIRETLLDIIVTVNNMFKNAQYIHPACFMSQDVSLPLKVCGDWVAACSRTEIFQSAKRVSICLSSIVLDKQQFLSAGFFSSKLDITF